jgi:hypothetical protein
MDEILVSKSASPSPSTYTFVSISVLPAVILLELPQPQATYHLHYEIIQAFLRAGKSNPKLFEFIFLHGPKLPELIIAADYLMSDRILLLHAFIASYQKNPSLFESLVGNLRPNVASIVKITL